MAGVMTNRTTPCPPPPPHDPPVGLVSYADAKAYAARQRLTSKRKWLAHSRNAGRPATVPHRPDHVYAESGWRGWDDFLPRRFATFVQAQRHAVKHRLRTMAQWTAAVKRDPSSMYPARADKVYKGKGWRGWEHFLQTLCVGLEFASRVAQRRGIGTAEEWAVAHATNMLPANFPKRPDKTYARLGVWRGWREFLGTGAHQATKRVRRS